MKFSIKKIDLPLKVEWKLSRNSTNMKTNLIIGTDQDPTILGEVAPNIRYGEDPDKVINQFYSFFADDFGSINEVRETLKERSIFHSLKYGIDQVLSQIECSRQSKSFNELFQLPSMNKVITSYSIPIMPIGEIADYLKSISHFRHLKLKVEPQGALELVQEVFKYFKGTLRVDANEGWADLDSFLKFQENIEHLPIEFIEQPFPAAMEDEYRALYPQSFFPIMADESIEDRADFSELKKMFHMVNVKLMKAGTIGNAIDLIQKAKQHHLKVMLGCMIETSLGISTAMRLSGACDFFDLDGFLLLKDDPFNLIEVKGDELILKN